jgi:hypothetical protein
MLEPQGVHLQDLLDHLDQEADDVIEVQVGEESKKKSPRKAADKVRQVRLRPKQIKWIPLKNCPQIARNPSQAMANWNLWLQLPRELYMVLA